jgi:uncharacterized protein (TIGR03435 family)
MLRRVAFMIGLLVAPRSPAQALATRPAFEVASVKPAPGGCRSFQSAGRISGCGSLALYIQIAYNLAAFGPYRRPGRRLAILGGPEWVKSDPYEIIAKAAGDAPSDQMNGPMMQTLLEERFQLRIRRETREMPVFILTVAKSGLKLKPLEAGTCTPPDLNHPPADPPPGEAKPNYCGDWRASPEANNTGGRNITMDSRGESMADFAADLSNFGSDRVVIDKTGVTGLFNIHLEFAQDRPPSASGDRASSTNPASPSIFSAVQEQLGLRLTAGKGPVEVLVIDRVERPSLN